MKKMTKFEKLGLEKKLLDTLDDAGFTIPFPIQERTIPVLLAGSDVIGQAHTGTGKTIAYALPMLQLITVKQGIQGIVMTPTRELALQVTTEFNKFAKNTGIKTATIYGGQSITSASSSTTCFTMFSFFGGMYFMKFFIFCDY